MGYALLLATRLMLDSVFTPAVRSYWERLHGRPAFLAAKAVQNEEPYWASA